jgi:GntR family transcriptional repressor for pyruvate dehydrogenase complex
MTFIAGMVLESRIESLGQPGRPEQSLASHRKIADAIRAKDSVSAAAAMLDHIELVSDVALLKNA